jgi:two-component system, OmpR family, response regulator TrcR
MCHLSKKETKEDPEKGLTVVDRQVLLEELWGSDNMFNSKTMNVYINRLRNYLEGDKSVEIITIRGPS